MSPGMSWLLIAWVGVMVTVAFWALASWDRERSGWGDDDE